MADCTVVCSTCFKTIACTTAHPGQRVSLSDNPTQVPTRDLQSTQGVSSLPQRTCSQLRQSSDLWQPALCPQHQCPGSLIPLPHLVVHWVAACSRGVTGLTGSQADAVLAAPAHESAKACLRQGLSQWHLCLPAACRETTDLPWPAFGRGQSSYRCSTSGGPKRSNATALMPEGPV